MTGAAWDPTPAPPECGATRGRGKVACEKPVGHDEPDHPFPNAGADHVGRGRRGRWYHWTDPEAPDAG